MQPPRAEVGERILVIEDDNATREVITLALLGEGYRPFAAADGAAGLTVVARSGPFGLILLDLRMPVMDGWRFAECYQRQPGPHAPLVVLTARTVVDAAAAAKQIGAAGFMAKPFDLDELTAVVARCVRPQPPRAASAASAPFARPATPTLKSG